MEDREIIALYFDRAESAVAETAKKYGNYLSMLARRILFSAEEAEEVVNEVYLRTWNAIPPAHPEKLGSFLARITRNAALDRLEYLHAAKRSGKTDALLSELSDCIPDSTNVEAAVLEQEVSARINDFLKTIDADARVFFLDRYFFTYSIAEISEKTGASIPRIKSSLHRTRRHLREFLEREGIL